MAKKSIPEKPPESQAKLMKQENNRRYYAKNRQKILDQKREYLENNKDDIHRKKKERYERDKDRLLAEKRLRYAENPEKFTDRVKRHYQKNKDKKLAYNKEYYEKNAEQLREYAKIYGVENREARLGYGKEYYRNVLKPKSSEYYEKNKDRILEYSRGYRRKHRDRICESRRLKLKNSIRLRLNHRMSTHIRVSLLNGKNGYKWESLVGYTVEDLEKHLKRTLRKDIFWESFIKNPEDYHIDHIIPVSAFNYENEKDIDFKRCWALENLRIIPKSENLKKKDKLSAPFQPSLAFGGAL